MMYDEDFQVLSEIEVFSYIMYHKQFKNVGFLDALMHIQISITAYKPA